MTFLYMIEYKLVKGAYKPIGVWCLGDGPGLDLEIRMRPGYPDEQDAADWVINRVVESDVTHLDRSFLEHHRDSMSPYDGMRSEIVATDRYPNRDALFDDLFRQIKEGRIT